MRKCRLLLAIVSYWLTISYHRCAFQAQIPPLSDSYCQCSSCRDITDGTKSLTSMQEFGPAIDLRVGDRVMVDGYLPGVVKYVGDLDSHYTNSPTYVGVKLDDPGQ